MGYISKTNFAKKHGFSKQYVSELLREGVLQEESNGMLDEDNADYALSLKQQSRGNKSKLQELFLKAKLQNELERGKLLKLETAEKEQSLIPAEQVKDTLFRKSRAIREAFTNLPDRVASALEMQDKRTIHITLSKEIRSILEELTSGS
jgi:hypothetical protein